MDSFKLKNQRVKHILPIGHSQGNLTVVSEVYSVRKSTLSTQRCVDCLCECGNTVQVSVSRLASGKAKSCGCLNKEVVNRKRLSNDDRVKNSLIHEYKHSAKQRRLVYELSENFLFVSVKSNCHYCGKPPNKSHRKCDTFLYNGLDRVDNSIGYIASNVVPCCYTCNKMKGVLTKEDFMEHLNSIFTRVG